MTTSTDDLTYMAEAVQLARLGLYSTSPNPRVGCVIVEQGEVIGRGFHVQAGGPHAEIHALQSVAEQHRPRLARATAYVTLEPCSHQGRTGPCCQALVDAGVARVVYAMQDPNPQVAGRGLAMMRAAGLQVDGPLLESEAQALNPGFIRRMSQGRPYIRIKLAASLDGRTAMASGESQWITGPAARAQVQALRAQSCAVISGHTTVSHDSARLTVRTEQLPDIGAAPLGHPVAESIRQPLRVVLDGAGGLSGTEDFFAEPYPILWLTRHQQAAVASHVQILDLSDASGRVNLPALVAELARRDCNELLVEAGPTLAGQFVEQGLVDELIMFVAPTLMGSNGRPLIALPLASMSEKIDLNIVDIRAVGNDWRITARPLSPQTEQSPQNRR